MRSQSHVNARNPLPRSYDGIILNSEDFAAKLSAVKSALSPSLTGNHAMG